MTTQYSGFPYSVDRLKNKIFQDKIPLKWKCGKSYYSLSNEAIIHEFVSNHSMLDLNCENFIKQIDTGDENAKHNEIYIGSEHMLFPCADLRCHHETASVSQIINIVSTSFV